MICRVCRAEKEAGPVLPDVCEPCTNDATQLLQPSHRLGDKVASVTKAMGLKPKPDCGCIKRQKALNNVNFNDAPGAVAKALLQAILNPPKE